MWRWPWRVEDVGPFAALEHQQVGAAGAERAVAREVQEQGALIQILGHHRDVTTFLRV